MASGNALSKLERARALLPSGPAADVCRDHPDADELPEVAHVDPTLPWPALLLALTGIDALLCPRCQQRAMVREPLLPARASPAEREST